MLSELLRIRRPKPAQSGSPLDLENLVLVGTHHKTGTALLTGILWKLREALGLKVRKGSGIPLDPGFYAHFEIQSKFNFNEVDRPYRGLHIIRDPRDLVVSAAHYHQRADEEWLHVPRNDFGGITYQEKIKSLPTLEDKILFEMDQCSGRQIRMLLAWDYSRPEFFETTLEDLIEDRSLTLYHAIFVHLGFPGWAIPKCLEAAYDNSLFSGKVKKSTHVRSGKRAEWSKLFTPHLRRRFNDLFPGAVIRLGYETSDSWVEELAADSNCSTTAA